MGFEALLGNEQLKENLTAARRKERMSHFYLLSGPRGSGKHTLAQLIAAAMLCESKDGPCGVCRHCRKVLSGNHPDYITIDDPEKKTVPVDLIRDARADIYVQPNEADKKIYMFAQSMRMESQNALLKILEEPPAHAVFLLLASSREEMLATIRSRCVIWEMQPIAAEEGVPFLRERYPEAERIETLLKAAGGNLGKAMEYLEGGNLLTYGDLGIRFLGKLCRNKMLEADRMLAGLPKGDFIVFLSSFSRLAQDFLLYKTGSGEENIVFLESILQIKAFLGRMRLEQLYKIAALTLDTINMLKQNGNENLVKTCFIAEMGELLR